jgi:hypothetical protein
VRGRKGEAFKGRPDANEVDMGEHGPRGAGSNDGGGLGVGTGTGGGRPAMEEKVGGGGESGRRPSTPLHIPRRPYQGSQQAKTRQAQARLVKRGF